MQEHAQEPAAKEEKNEENVNIRKLRCGTTNVTLVEHFSARQTYSDIIRAALRREFAD